MHVLLSLGAGAAAGCRCCVLRVCGSLGAGAAAGPLPCALGSLGALQGAAAVCVCRCCVLFRTWVCGPCALWSLGVAAECMARGAAAVCLLELGCGAAASRVPFGTWVLVPLRCAAARCVAVCALELGRCRVPRQCAAHKSIFAIWDLCQA